jgi:hypothetical protein
MRLVLGLAIGLLTLVPVWGQVCSNVSIQGNYALTCTGYVTPAASAPQVPFSGIGVLKIDYNGSATGTAKVSVGGTILDQAVTGTAVVNSDCTGTVVYDQKLNGQPGPKLNIVYHVLESGKEIRGMSVDAGSTMTCNLRLISR